MKLIVSTDPPNIKWAKGYTFGNAESHPHSGVQTSDGGFLMVGDGVDYANRTIVKRHIYVAKIDSAGNLQWQQNFGDVGFNYGKFGIELSDGTFLIAGAKSVSDGIYGVIEKRALFRISKNGKVMGETLFANNGEREHLRDGFMCVNIVSDKPNTVIATGYVGGENATSGYDDEPMFLIPGGHPFIMELTYTPNTYKMNVVFDNIIHDTPHIKVYQGMRIFYDSIRGAYALSTTAVYRNDTGNIQMGLISTNLDGKENWLKIFIADNPPHSGHASHPYALTLAPDNSGYTIAGLAVGLDSKGIEQCEGRVLKVDSKGNLVWDQRFREPGKDLNTECYGISPTDDNGYVITCGTGVEPELHPHDTPEEKTWRALVHRTDNKGNQLWQQTYTTRDKLQNNAGEYIVTTKNGEYAVYVDSQTYGSSSTGGNFAIILLNSDV